MGEPSVAAKSLANDILNRVEQLLLQAESESRPLEIDPYRSSLFELFVAAEGAGYLVEDGDPDLTSDALSHQLAQRWNLADAARDAMQQQTRIPPQSLGRMRLLWSLLRMWMEWTYAWQRWPEFHGGSTGAKQDS
ncbi:MAG TPA: hypothetical protein VHB77_06530 [Planctomycetaceae bacterium]|nr:hypothetical protein [Planctomycetaceae bacterium]